MTTVTIPSDPTTPLSGPAPAPTTPLSTTIRIATRKSTLARVQTALVSAALTKAFPSYTTQIIALDTMGDVDKSTPLHSFNAKALWTTELEDLLEKGICRRSSPRAWDAVCIAPALEGKGVETLGQLERGSVVGTSSLRRSAQLKRRFPGLEFKDVRGNVGTRLGKLDAEGGEYAALILAAAGLRRLGLESRISSLLSSGEGGVLHAVGQGALGIEIRGDDERMREVCEGIGEERSWRAALAERSVMRTLEGGCSVPIGVETEWVKKGTGIAGEGAGVGVKPSEEYDGVTGLAKDEDGRSDELLLRGIVVSLDGQQAVEAEMRRVIKSREEADEFGWDMAQKLVEGGAAKILEDINLNRKIIQEQGGA
ncbi:hypothetical protein KVT40_000902 [Elsinoe batatas]|uniref:hydroxymethylbilane synthase n=1 Tax=Elsinoe batatas TaxID=2601811 RepID=A0A8K0L9L3_9PEZI|nr:hypothetical protein KVT40_000902 [Elsinoe batatas]